MSAPMHPLPEYRDRTVDCETCCGEGAVIEFRRFAGEYQAGEPVEVACPDCDGSGEWPAQCADCGKIKPLNEDGVCRDCSELALTETIGDPLLAKNWRAA